MDHKEHGRVYDPLDNFRLAPTRQLVHEEELAIDRVRKAAVVFQDVICECVPASRERSLAITHLEDAVTRAVRGITE